MNILCDNSECDLLLKKLKVKLVREIKAVSNQGVEFVEKTDLIKRKDGNVEAKVAEYKNFHLPLEQLDFKSS